MLKFFKKIYYKLFVYDIYSFIYAHYLFKKFSINYIVFLRNNFLKKINSLSKKIITINIYFILFNYYCSFKQYMWQYYTFSISFLKINRVFLPSFKISYFFLLKKC